jgi:hypothetical protein
MDFKKLRANSVIEPLRGIRARYKDFRDLLSYSLRPTIPAPHVVKFRTIMYYRNLHNIAILIETGTFEGEMVRKCRGLFREIWTIQAIS